MSGLDITSLELSFTGFDSYDAKVTDKTKLTVNGLEGSIVYDFLAVPRHQGSYEIPAIEYTYFDTKSNSYKTVRTEPFTLKVAKGDGQTNLLGIAGCARRYLPVVVHHLPPSCH